MGDGLGQEAEDRFAITQPLFKFAGDFFWAFFLTDTATGTFFIVYIAGFLLYSKGKISRFTFY